MADGSAIEWLARPGTRPATWNMIRARRVVPGSSPGQAPKVLLGWHCEHVTGACKLCYAGVQNERGFRGGTRLPFKPGHRDDVEIFLDEKALQAPLHWREPRTIFVCSMSDLYGAWVTDAWLDRIHEVMALCPQHVFIVLTKRPERQRAYLTQLTRQEWWKARLYEDGARPVIYPDWPLPNVWGGTSCGDQDDLDRFGPELAATPLSKRIVSFEPLLGPVALQMIPCSLPGHVAGGCYSTLSGEWWPALADVAREHRERLTDLPRLDWVIIGGESGSKAEARVHDIAWDRAIIRQCRAAGVAVFVKQLGSNPMVSMIDDMPAQPSDVDPADLAAYARQWAETPLQLRHKKGADPTEWPLDLRVRQWPDVAEYPSSRSAGVGAHP